MTRLRDLVRSEPKRGVVLPRAVERLLSVGIVTQDAQLARRQRCANVAAYAMAANTLVYLLLFNTTSDFEGLQILNLYNAGVMVGALLAPQLHRLSDNAATFWLIFLLLCGNMFAVWALGLNSDVHIYFTFAGAMLFVFGVQNWKLFLGFFPLFVAALLISLNFAPAEGLLLPNDSSLTDMLSSNALINTITINAAIIFYALSALRQAEMELETQYERSEALVTTVMPASIAARLKSGAEDRIADRIENLTVLFADLAGFTAAAHDRSPDEIVDYLDRLMRTFDALAETHGVEKIKTIGDCYMAAAGLDGRAHEGALAIGRFAFAILAAIDGQPPLGGRKLGLRVGIHAGPATAGVIGDTRFSYDVWGDAVNTASRMESHGLPGRIQVSEAYRALAGDAFAYDERGSTDIKGLGNARTYFLRPRAANATPDLPQARRAG
jgi:adenylate cyclase